MPTITSTLIRTQGGTGSDLRPPMRLVDPEALICPGCGEQIRCAPYLEPLQRRP